MNSALSILPIAAAMLVTSSTTALATEADYRCSGGTMLAARFSPLGAAVGHVVLTFADGRSVTLSQQLSADGGRYADDRTEFWIKGRGATLRRGSDSETCSTP